MASNLQPPNRRKQEELIAVLVALLSFGGIFWWATSRQAGGFNWTSLLQTPLFSTPAAIAPSPSLPSPEPTTALGGSSAPMGTSSTPLDTAQVVPSPAASTAIAPAPFSSAKTAPLPGSGGVSSMPRSAAPDGSATPSPGNSPTSAPVPTAASTAKPPTPKATVSFADVPANYWAAPFILELGKRGILEGIGQQGIGQQSFQPNKPVTRAEFAALVQKAFFDRTKTRPTMEFSDIQANYWAVPAINEAVQLGFMNGYPDRRFLATNPIPKLEGIVAMVAGLQLQGTPKTNITRVFQDAQQIPQWATEKVARATDAGLVVSYPNSKLLTPKQVMTRADAAVLIYQALVQEGKAKPLASAFIAKPQ